MSQDNDNYSRRQLLGAATGVGVLGLSTGAATRAYLTDGEAFSGNRLQAGAFTLELAGAGATGTDHVANFPDEGDFSDEESLSVDFPELEPGDDGVFTAAYRLCENPGRVWFRSRLVGAEDTDLEDHLSVRLSTRPTCEEDPATRFEGTVGAFHDAFGGGSTLECRHVGKLEYDDGGFSAEAGVTTENDDGVTVEFTTPDGEPVTIQLTVTETKQGGEIVEFGYEVLEGPGVCEVVVAGGADPGPESPGPKRERYTPECALSADGLATPEKDAGPGDGRYGLSHVEFFVCGDCRDCVPGCLDLEWSFDENPPEDLLGDSLRLELEFLAVQCRHRTDPINPWS